MNILICVSSEGEADAARCMLEQHNLMDPATGMVNKCTFATSFMSALGELCSANEKLEVIKAPFTPVSANDALIEQVEVIDGRVTSDTSIVADILTDQSTQPSSEDAQESSGVINQDGANADTGQVLGVSYSNNEAVMQALKDKPFDVVLYFLISALQWLLMHWQLTLGVALIITALLLGKRFLHA